MFSKALNRQKVTNQFNGAETEESDLKRKKKASEVNGTIAESFQRSMKTGFGGLECLSIDTTEDGTSLHSEG